MLLKKSLKLLLAISIIVLMVNCAKKDQPGEGLLNNSGQITIKAACGTLSPGQTLSGGQYITSCNNRFKFIMQTDGNLVLYYGNTALWNSGTWNHSGSYAVMQGDGNLVVYQNGTALWNSGTWGYSGAYLAVQDDGNAVIYKDGVWKWQSYTGGIPQAQQGLPALINPHIVTGKQAFPAQSIFTEIKKIPGGASGTQLVVVVDVDRAKTYVPKSTDPYYYKYYTSFWEGGVHAVNQVPSSYYSDSGPVGYNNSSAYYVKANYNFPNCKWYDSFLLGAVGSNYKWVHHIQNKIVGSSQTWLPNGAGVGTNYYQNGNPLNNVTLNFRAELGKKLTLSNGYQTYQKVLAGEVTPEGWGIVPMTKDIPAGKGFFQWVWMVPTGQNYKVHGAKVTCPGKGCTFNCQNGTCSTYCWDNSYHVTHLVDPPLPLAEAELVNSMNNTMPMGGGSAADMAANGKMYYIGTDGTVAELPIDAARVYAGWTGQIFVNGSMNSLSDAQKNAISLAQSQGRALVLLYMAQSIDYTNHSANSVVANNLQDLTTNYTRGYGDQKIEVISHSWSGHIVQNVIKNNTNVTHVAINPAQGPFDPAISWTNDLNNATATTYIMTGYQDIVTAAGQGSGYLDPRHGDGFISGSTTVYNIINSKPNIDSKIIYGASHGIDSMINNGLQSQMPAKPVR